ncbi:hypothetical protein GCM10022228_00920 [Halomonas cibimaris]|uniref:Uncharacterized protein n=1 Tax=Halomonas cibimaris TaxID=657012 RepID=A0ABP7L230_9GAMM
MAAGRIVLGREQGKGADANFVNGVGIGVVFLQLVKMSGIERKCGAYRAMLMRCVRGLKRYRSARRGSGASD